MTPAAQRALVIHPAFKFTKSSRDPEARLEEAASLARAIALEVVGRETANITVPKPATLFGRGKVEQIASLVEACEAGLVIVDHALSPVQQRNLEKAWQCKVIDRTALILEIFGDRARTAEGKLQVELAALEYQKSRLVRSWTHLERQRGGFGFMGGPGESQIEIDRRLIRDRIAKIKRELETVSRTRELHRSKRRDVPYPIIALVGYTNAGKSTLFNRLTGARVHAADQLFATLDPTMRGIKLPGGEQVILSDTVGFVSDLPHELIAAFRATLEEVLEADVLLHVRDIAHEDTEAQKRDVETVLQEIFGERQLPEHLVEVRNKIDLLNRSDFEFAPESDRLVYISAVTGEGVERLLHRLDAMLEQRRSCEEHIRLRMDEGRLLAWLHQHGKVLEQREEGGYLYVVARLAPADRARFEKMHLSSGNG